MTATAAARRPAGRPRKVPRGSIRYTVAVDPVVREVADSRAEREAAAAGQPQTAVRGDRLADVMRALMEEYAAGRLTITPWPSGG